MDSLINCQTLDVNYIAVNHLPFVVGLPPKKDMGLFVRAIKSVMVFPV